MAPGGTIVSLLSSRTFVPRLARMPMLLPPANPVFRPASMTWTFANALAASALPSVDALSTTMISCERAGGASRSEARQRRRSSRALNETTIIETSGIVQ